MKQDQAERKRKDKLTEKLSSIRAEARKKNKDLGKKPFYLKKSAIKEIALEQRYIYMYFSICILYVYCYHMTVNYYTLHSCTLHNHIIYFYTHYIYVYYTILHYTIQ